MPTKPKTAERKAASPAAGTVHAAPSNRNTAPPETAPTTPPGTAASSWNVAPAGPAACLHCAREGAATNAARASPVASLTTSPRPSSSTRNGSRRCRGGASHATRRLGASSLLAVPT